MNKLPENQLSSKVKQFFKAYKNRFGTLPDKKYVAEIIGMNIVREEVSYIEAALCDFHPETKTKLREKVLELDTEELNGTNAPKEEAALKADPGDGPKRTRQVFKSPNKPGKKGKRVASKTPRNTKRG